LRASRDRTYAAIPWPKGGCAFYIYNSTGKLYNSGSYTNAFDKPVVEVNTLCVQRADFRRWVAHRG
jgi:hypothetical protein